MCFISSEMKRCFESENTENELKLIMNNQLTVFWGKSWVRGRGGVPARARAAHVTVVSQVTRLDKK